MDYCSDIMNLRALYGGDHAQPLRGRAAEIEQQLQRLTTAMLAAEGGAAPATFVRLAHQLEADQTGVASGISAAERQLASLARGDVNGADAKWRAPAAGVIKLDVDARLQARQLVADTFERIVVYASGMRLGPGKRDRRVTSG